MKTKEEARLNTFKELWRPVYSRMFTQLDCIILYIICSIPLVYVRLSHWKEGRTFEVCGEEV